MNIKSVVFTRRALNDIDDAVNYYTAEVSADVAERFVLALSTATDAIAARPAIGSPRYAHELGLPGLRSRKLARFPYLVLYIEQISHIDAWRILHMRRNIPASLQDPEAN